MVRAAQKDPQQFEGLYKTYYPRILAFAYQRLDSKEAAYEVTAQAFYNALDNLKKYKPTGVPFGAWLFRIASNEVNQWYRKNKRERAINIDEEGFNNLKQEVDNKVEDEKRLFNAIQILDADEIDLIDLRFFENRSFKEICEITGLGESACKMRIYRILEKLKTELLKTQ